MTVVGAAAGLLFACGGEAEEHEAAADFAGNGIAGRLILNAIGGYDGAVRVGISTRTE